MRYGAAVGCAVLLALTGPKAAAQVTVTGRVVSDSTGLAVAEAEVLIAALGQRTLSTADGRYRLTAIPLGTHVLEVRRLGYTPLRLTLILDETDDVELEIVMTPAAYELPTLTAEAVRIRSARLAELEHRQRTGGARHITADDLAARKGSSLADVLRSRGVNVAHDARRFLSLPMGRGEPDLLQRTNSCIMHVIIDGLEVAPETLDLVSHPIDRYAAIEIYQRPTEIPVEFAKTGINCGAILLWTRVHIGS